MGPFPARATDVDVVRDLMIHDIDIVQRLVGAEPERVDAIGVPVLTDKVDIANARLTFPGGAVANLTASRVSPTPMRKLRFFQADGYFSIDFLEQAVVIAQREAATAGGERKITALRVPIDRGDALAEQLQAFLRGVRARRVEAGDADQGALRAAHRAARDRGDAAPGNAALKTVLISAGDASGELHAAALVEELRRRHPGVRVLGLGGAAMEKAGVEMVVPQRELAVAARRRGAPRPAPHRLGLAPHDARAAPSRSPTS